MLHILGRGGSAQEPSSRQMRDTMRGVAMSRACGEAADDAPVLLDEWAVLSAMLGSDDGGFIV